MNSLLTGARRTTHADVLALVDEDLSIGVDLFRVLAFVVFGALSVVGEYGADERQRAAVVPGVAPLRRGEIARGDELQLFTERQARADGRSVLLHVLLVLQRLQGAPARLLRRCQLLLQIAVLQMQAGHYRFQMLPFTCHHHIIN